MAISGSLHFVTASDQGTLGFYGAAVALETHRQFLLTTLGEKCEWDGEGSGGSNYCKFNPVDFVGMNRLYFGVPLGWNNRQRLQPRRRSQPRRCCVLRGISRIQELPIWKLQLASLLRRFNPRRGNGQRINLNLNISDNIPALLQSLQSGRSIAEALERKLQAR